MKFTKLPAEMMMTPTTTLPPHLDIASELRELGLTYWQKLVREGAPKDEARQIAAAIAKFDMFQRSPSAEQKQLISQFSRFVCRAQLWRCELLL